MEQVNAAKRWFENQKMNGKTRSHESSIQILRSDPSWKYYAINHKENFTVVDIDLTDCVSLDFVPQDNYSAFQKTKNWEFRRSHTRLVYVVDKKTNKENGFFMTIIPSKYYAKTYSKRIKRNTYLHRDKYLSGYVLFHRLDGKFANGWEYKRGKVIKKVSMRKKDETLNPKEILVRTLAANYKVAPKVYRPTQTRSGSEDDWDIDGGWIPEVEITPDWDIDGGELGEVIITPEPDPDPNDPNCPEPEPEPDPNEGLYWNDEDNSYVTGDDTKDPHEDFDRVVKDILSRLKRMGIDVSKVVIVKSNECSANARVTDGKIEICAEFYRWDPNTQTAIVWHELFHLNNDRPCNTDFQHLPEPIVT